MASLQPMGQFLCFGDSITQQFFSQDSTPSGLRGSFGPRLTDAYMRKLDIVNRGFSGYNTRQALAVLPQLFGCISEPRILLIFFGANDARLPDTGEPSQHVPIGEYLANMESLVFSIQKQWPKTWLILITPPPIDERKTLEAARESSHAEDEIVLQRHATVTEQYVDVVLKLQIQLGVSVLDIWTAMMRRAGYKQRVDNPISNASLPGSREAPLNEVLRSFLSDGLHLSRKGYDLLFEELMALIDSLCPDLLPANLPTAFPLWDDMDAWTAEGALRNVTDDHKL